MSFEYQIKQTSIEQVWPTDRRASGDDVLIADLQVYLREVVSFPI